jgi:hypothetical protein
MHVDAVPVNAVTVKEVNMSTLGVVLSVQIGVIAIRIPPPSPVMAGAVVVASPVVVTIMCTEHVSVMVVSY